MNTPTPYKQLFIFVEGTDDERFIKSIILPLFVDKYSVIKIIQYAQLPKQTIDKFIRTCNQQKVSEYIFLCDMDAMGKTTLCLTFRKEKKQEEYCSYLDQDKIVFVMEEIESWYFSGIPDEKITEYKIKNYANTDHFTKETFDKIKPKSFSSKTDFMIEILNFFSIEKARQLNSSLDYFLKKHIES